MSEAAPNGWVNPQPVPSEAASDDLVNSRPSRPPVGLGRAALALALPVLSGIAFFFITSQAVAWAVSLSMVFGTAALLSVDASRLGRVDLKGRRHDGDVMSLFLAMLFLWIIFYPYAFFRRRSFGGPNLGPLALVAAGLFLAGSFHPLWMPPGLPSCSSPEVVEVLKQLVRDTVASGTLKSIDGFREQGFDRGAQVRHGVCVAHTETDDVQVQFTVEWLDRQSGQFQVRLFSNTLPSCNSVEVVQVLERAIRSSSLGSSLKSVDGHRELANDRNAGIRQGQCVAHTQTEDVPLQFVVEWLNRDKGEFQVRVLPGDVPSCTSEEVAKLLEQVLRSTPMGATLKSIDGHRELAFDRQAGTRRGQCVVHTETGDVHVQSNVEWEDRDAGRFRVRILPAEKLLDEAIQSPPVG